ncbi:MAG TPA: 7-cyano-7-deazaguanine synthase QueC [Thermodesulfobacteriota bacterium]|nr:7-cyano-7-deazaguanine synthase QueC [Thermodesulfobacteriota bacterium]
MERKAVVLLSGGMDSTTTLAIAKKEGFGIYALSFDYGQRNSLEIKKAVKIAASFGAKDHLIIPVHLKKIGGSSLTSKEISLPKGRDLRKVGKEIPSTYVPARNTIFLSYALAWAEVLGAGDIFIGVNAIDCSGYPDTRPEYINAFEQMANLATKAGVEGELKFKIHIPLINLSKADIIKKGMELGVDYSLTQSCYDPFPDGRACGECDSCKLRLKGFEEAGFKDPISYKEIR